MLPPSTKENIVEQSPDINFDNYKCGVFIAIHKETNKIGMSSFGDFAQILGLVEMAEAITRAKAINMFPRENKKDESKDIIEEINKIINEPGINWKIRRALLRHKCGLDEKSINELCPQESKADY